MNVGARLRDARNSQGLTLRQVGDVTKLSMTTLRRLEDGEFEALPGGILIKGYLRAYAAAVGLPPEEIVREYLAQSVDGRTTEPLPAPPSMSRRLSGARLLAAAIVVGVAAVAYLSQARSGDGADGFPAALEVPHATPPLTSGLDRNAVSTVARPFRLALGIQSTGVCWISVSVDGKRSIHRLFQPGDRSFVAADEQLVLRVGEPGAFVYTLNGVAGRPLGEPGQPVTVTITRENYEMFIDRDARNPSRLPIPQPRATVRNTSWPSRQISTRAVPCSSTRRRAAAASFALVTRLRLTSRMTSPARTPARAASLAGCTSVTSAPWRPDGTCN
jgi:cytoskeleton protein RodZ